jgi:uncharacterized protein YutD
MSIYTKIYNLVLPLINSEDFKIPNNQKEDSYFPEYLENLLNKYIEFYKNNLSETIESVVPFVEIDGVKNKDVILKKIETLTKIIIDSVNLYYEGKTHKASENFITNLNKNSISELTISSLIKKDTSFYRARKSNGKQFKTSDLYHIKYEQRHNVSTNRYSIPGLPALYLGSTTYVCWEEFEKAKLRDLWFVKLENQNDLKVILIQRIEDYLAEIENMGEAYKLTYLLAYLVTFPLTLSTTIKVKNTSGSFKPEYIIPQMLFEYIASNKSIDGIKFPSTKVDYNSLTNVEAYNYVFPVKKITKKGYCSDLSNTFHLTEPTSLDLEEIIHNPPTTTMVHGLGTPIDDREIELIKDVKVKYNKTSFGKLESKLKSREVYKVK